MNKFTSYLLTIALLTFCGCFKNSQNVIKLKETTITNQITINKTDSLNIINPDNEIEYEKIQKDTLYNDKAILRIITKLKYNEFSILMLTDLYVDSFEKDTLLSQKSGIYNQEIIFFKKDSIINHFNYIPKQVKIKSDKDVNYLLNESTIGSVCLIEGNDDWCIRFYGGYVTNYIQEFELFFSKEGELIYHIDFYNDEYGFHKTETGSFKTLLNKYSLETEDLTNYLYKNDFY